MKRTKGSQFTNAGATKELKTDASDSRTDTDGWVCARRIVISCHRHLWAYCVEEPPAELAADSVISVSRLS